MAVDFSAEVDHVARLARLALGPEEKKRLAGQLQKILDTAKKIQELDTTGIEPTSHVTDLPAVLRADLTGPSLPLSAVLQNAPRRESSYFRVPRIATTEPVEE